MSNATLVNAAGVEVGNTTNPLIVSPVSSGVDQDVNLAAVAGTATAVGVGAADGGTQRIAVASDSVVRIDGVADAAVATGSVTSATAILTVNTTGYDYAAIQFTSVGAGNTVLVENSMDGTAGTGTTFVTSGVTRMAAVADAMGLSISPNLTTTWFAPILGNTMRLRVSVYSSGTVTAYLMLKRGATPAPLSQRVDLGSIAGGTAGQGNGAATTALRVSVANDSTGQVNIATRTTGGPTRARVQSAATVNETSVKGSAGQVYAIHVANNHATNKAYLKLYNKATAPTAGTDVPVATHLIPASGARDIPVSYGDAFATGIGYAITGGAADSDTTAVAADQVTGILLYQ